MWFERYSWLRYRRNWTSSKLLPSELVFMVATHEKIHEIIPVKMLGKEMKLFHRFRLEFHGLKILDSKMTRPFL